MKALQIQVQENRGTVTRLELEEAELKEERSPGWSWRRQS